MINDKHDMTPKHDHSMQTLTQQQHGHTSNTICSLQEKLFSQIFTKRRALVFWSTEAPPKTDNDWLFAPAVDDQLTEQTVI